MLTEYGSGAAGRTGAKDPGFQNCRPDASDGKMMGDGQAHHSTTDDDDVGPVQGCSIRAVGPWGVRDAWLTRIRHSAFSRSRIQTCVPWPENTSRATDSMT